MLLKELSHWPQCLSEHPEARCQRKEADYIKDWSQAGSTKGPAIRRVEEKQRSRVNCRGQKDSLFWQTSEKVQVQQCTLNLNNRHSKESTCNGPSKLCVHRQSHGRQKPWHGDTDWHGDDPLQLLLEAESFPFAVVAWRHRDHAPKKVWDHTKLKTVIRYVYSIFKKIITHCVWPERCLDG